MRIGFNPHKDQKQKASDYFHQIIIPVYIPNQKDYFKDSFQILEYCIESLFKTCHSKTFFTVVNNGSSPEISNYLNELLAQRKVHEVIHTTNIGKLNAILKGLSGHKFKLITITDADVLFLNNWQEATYEVFSKIPKSGAVSPVPSSRLYNYYTHNILFEKFFSKSLKFTKVKNPEAMKEFAISVDNSEFYNSNHLNTYLTVEMSKCKAVVGAGHFVCTYRGDIFADKKENYSPYNLGGSSERFFLDKPVVKKGYWRLSTEDNYAFHMGNVTEPWMGEKLGQLELQRGEIELLNIKKLHVIKPYIWISNKLLSIIIAKKSLKKIFLKYKGLSPEALNDY